MSTEGAFAVLARSRELEAQGRALVHLEVGEPDFDTPEHIKRAGIAAIEANQTHYTPSSGIAPLRDAVAVYAAKFRGLDPISRDEVVISPGLKILIWNVLVALLDAGDEIMYADPAYQSYSNGAAYLGARAVPIRLLEETNFRLDLDEFAAKISDRTKVLVLNFPHNPTGGVLTRDDLERIAELCIKHDVIVVSDEIYCRNIYDREFVSIASLPGMRERTIILDGFSKAYAMTGWRLAYGIMPAAIARDVILINNNTFSCTATFVQYAGIAALQGPDGPTQAMVQEFARRRAVMVNGLNSLPGFACPMPAGAFYAFPNVSQITRDDKQLASFLLEEGSVAAIGGSCFGDAGRGYMRFSYANSLENITLAIERMRAVLPRFKPA
ncbi:MAG TPA: pyridoxal phosphate-dependent aminotransferase [Candidatus Acidoferrales bacterium]|nr:pyridoxal phosphate-dependent aminotransferase [Candidatus Acidoferrales bacterium]